MPASSRNSQAGGAASENSALKCKTCGKSFAAPDGHASEASAALVEEESVRCSRMREITQQRQALAARIQAGIAGMLGSDRLDTVDQVAQRATLSHLDATLKTEVDGLAKVMLHVPKEP